MNQTINREAIRELDAMLCARCGAVLAGDLLFCTVCGTAAPTTLRTLAGDDAGDEGAVGAAAAVFAANLALRPDRLSVTEVLSRHGVFSLLPPGPSQLLAISCFRRRYVAGEWAVQEGQPGERAFFIGSGEAQVSVTTGRGRRVLVRMLGPGDFFGEPASITGGARTVTVRAITPLETYVFAQDALAELVRDYPVFGDALRRRAQVSALEVFLRRASPFAPLEPEVLYNLADHLEEISYRAGETVFREGEPGDAFYLVRRGTVDVVIGGRRVASLSVGDCFGEAALLNDIPRTAAIVVTENADLLRLSRENFRQVLDNYPLVFGFLVELQRRRNLPGPSQEAVAAARRTQTQRRVTRDPSITFGSTITAAQASASVAVVLALLASSSRGGYLIAPAAAAALAVAPLTALALARSSWLRLQTTRRSLLIAAILGVLLGFGAGVVPAVPAAAAVEGALTALVLAALVRISGGRFGRLLEFDEMAAGLTAGIGLGISSALAHWIIGAGGMIPPLSLASWFELLTGPARAALAGAVVGAAVWQIARHAVWAPIVRSLGLAAALLALGRLAVALELPPIPSVLLATASVVGLLVLARNQLHEAARSRTVTLATVGLGAALPQADDAAVRVTCRVCDTPATAGEVYCARCGQSLLEE
ncbi:MAG: cyclic nucleotide-binding domain-containing protein [Chloroflexi bacterium]|nr:cyclic nucleotide-binding domain-containing protein [Chloroflexota bacterium]